LLGAARPSGFSPRSNLDILTAVCENEMEGRDSFRGRRTSPHSMEVDIKREVEEDELDSPPLPKGTLSASEMDPEFRLPALRHMSEKPAHVHLHGLRTLGLAKDEWSSSPGRFSDLRTRTASPESEEREMYPKFTALLPSVAALLGADKKRSYDEALARNVGRMRLHSRPPPSRGSMEDRMRHAYLIQQIMLTVNNAWRRKEEEEEEDYEEEKTPLAPIRRSMTPEEDIKPIITW
jgi:hypothetical protein